MKILCALSSIEFTCEHIPGTFHSREIAHPIFSLPQKRLLAMTGKWAEGGLTPTDSYLLFLALLQSTDLIEWRIPVMRSEQTDSIVANNMEHLLRTVIKLPTVPNYEEVFPHYAISPDTRYLANVKYWIQNWHDRYDEFKSGYRSAHESAIIIRRENALARLIKSPHKKPADYAHALAEWAASAGSFPTFSVSSPFGSSLHAPIPCAEFWKEIIVRCTKDDYIFSIPDADLQELRDHCFDNIDAGSIFSHALFAILKRASERKNTFLDLGDPDIHSTYRILSSQQTAESANMTALIDSAPSTEPLREHYPSQFAFIRAKMRWNMAQKYGSSDSPDGPVPSASDPSDPV